MFVGSRYHHDAMGRERLSNAIVVLKRAACRELAVGADGEPRWPISHLA